LILSSLNFFLKADTFYRVHSPFVFDLLTHTLEDNRYFYEFDDIEKLRKELENNTALLNIVDLGAGSKKSNDSIRSIKDIVNTAVSPAYQSMFLFKLAQYIDAKNIVELGTSLGISTLYLSGFSSKSTVHTLEGSPAILGTAKSIFKAFKRENIVTYEGSFDQYLPKVLGKIPTLDLCYIDGNHAKAPTLNYFEWCLPYVNENSIIVFDDIYWSKDMTSAWEEVKEYKEVTMTVDLFYFGLVFFKKEFTEKQHFKVLDARFKPWQRYI